MSARCKCPGHDGTERWHGTCSGRQYHKCSCEACVEGTKAYHAEYWRISRQRRPCKRPDCQRVLRPGSRAHYCSSECRRAVRRELNRAREARRPWVKRRRALWELQGRTCALCHRRLDWEDAQLDHDHACCDTRIRNACGQCDRGVLHIYCNRMLDQCNDSLDVAEWRLALLRTRTGRRNEERADLMRLAIRYLRASRHGGTGNDQRL